MYGVQINQITVGMGLVCSTGEWGTESHFTFLLLMTETSKEIGNNGPERDSRGVSIIVDACGTGTGALAPGPPLGLGSSPLFLPTTPRPRKPSIFTTNTGEHRCDNAFFGLASYSRQVLAQSSSFTAGAPLLSVFSASQCKACLDHPKLESREP